MRFLALAAIASVLILCGCGYIGDPKPPAMRRPMKVAELGAVERGSKIVVTFRLPEFTTEGVPIATPPDVELRAGVVEGDWNVAEWEQNSERARVPELEIPPGGFHVALRAARPPRGAKGHSGAIAPTGKSRKPVAAAPPPVPPSWFERAVNFDAAKYAGKTVLIGIRVHGPNGQDDGWTTVRLPVVAPLSTPSGLQASDAPNAIRLRWAGNAESYRVYRRSPVTPAWEQVGEVAATQFDDSSAGFGKSWQYRVEGVRKAGDGFALSEVSTSIEFTGTDRFPPAVPTGVGAIPAPQSIELFWDRVPDADLAGYRVYRDGKVIAENVATPVYSDRDVSPGKRYRYEVTAIDTVGNESAKSVRFEVQME